jgi:hypothetical protein
MVRRGHDAASHRAAIFQYRGHRYRDRMCNLYSHTKGPKAIRDLANAMGISDRLWTLEELVKQSSK